MKEFSWHEQNGHVIYPNRNKWYLIDKKSKLIIPKIRNNSFLYTMFQHPNFIRFEKGIYIYKESNNKTLYLKFFIVSSVQKFW